MKVIDLFAGCGGFSVGFSQAGFSVVKAVEVDKQIAETYKFNHEETHMIVDDICNVDNEQFFTRGEAEVIIGGPPCQGFSMAGARIRGNNTKEDDPRNYLFKHYVNVVNIVRPDVFLLENVKGILTMNGGDVFKEIIKTFSDERIFGNDKYYLHYKIVKAVEYGVPQKRERVVIIGVKNKSVDIDKLFDATRKKIIATHPDFFDKVSVWDAISDLQNPTENGETVAGVAHSSYQRYLSGENNVIQNHICSKHSPKSVARMKNVAEGENWTVLNEVIHSVHSGAYGRLNKDDVSATITTRFDTPSGGRFIHPLEDRTITPREAARIQSFPDDFVFKGGKSSICKQIGNAVPPKMAYFLAELIKEIL